MSDLKSPTLIWAKGFLFLFLGLFAAVLLVLQAPSLTVAALLVLSIWAFCRAYYFAFYVIEHYVDSSYRFSGLISFLQYAIRPRRSGSEIPSEK
ncbi:MAG: hypothetical protein ACKVP0_15495 [Pirellulaceae bacterium]